MNQFISRLKCVLTFRTTCGHLLFYMWLIRPLIEWLMVKNDASTLWDKDSWFSQMLKKKLMLNQSNVSVSWIGIYVFWKKKEKTITVEVISFNSEIVGSETATTLNSCHVVHICTFFFFGFRVHTEWMVKLHYLIILFIRWWRDISALEVQNYQGVQELSLQDQKQGSLPYFVGFFFFQFFPSYRSRQRRVATLRNFVSPVESSPDIFSIISNLNRISTIWQATPSAWENNK